MKTIKKRIEKLEVVAFPEPISGDDVFQRMIKEMIGEDFDGDKWRKENPEQVKKYDLMTRAILEDVASRSR